MIDREARNAKARATRARNKIVNPISEPIYGLMDEIGACSDYEQEPKDYGSAEWIQRVRKLNAQLTERIFALEQYDFSVAAKESL